VLNGKLEQVKVDAHVVSLNSVQRNNRKRSLYSRTTRRVAVFVILIDPGPGVVFCVIDHGMSKRREALLSGSSTRCGGH